MREMRWTWAELQATPAEVRQYTWDVILRERAVGHERAQRAAKSREHAPGSTVIEY